ncbi:DUF4832 domain-containing protein [Oribacterium sp. WCC10]|uniref:DUF4832 domain-containing protein n=1 Tax=Oribacterium sp. WCC10 TaxID=1855343 RepID=UPI0008EC219B|nr:DUF4832 domain-containing protein [Oribacterium sp. WCC10]SFG26055.1 protein of unknown function [Oribacterium sp. WCC10]
MDKSKSYAIQYVIILVLAVLIGSILYYMAHRSDLNFEVKYSPDYTLTDNPLMGFAPDGANVELCEKTKLVYIPVKWSEWEPEDGVYDIEGLEKRYNIDRWKKEKKHAVLRFVCDVPGDVEHMDIPGWLYEKTGTGYFYDTELGKGYSPDYEDKVFIKYHTRAIEALADYCKKDYFVSFVQLGSLGHWGEWHATDNSGRSLMPSADICQQYAELYSQNFTNDRLMARRNYDFCVTGGMGVFNDMVGDHTDTDEWLQWINEGGAQDTKGKNLNLLTAPNIGMTAPVGGEFTSGIAMDEMLGTDLGEVLQDISDSQMTFIGPMVPDLTDEKYSTALDSIVKRMGYRIYVSNLKARYDFSKNTINLDVSFRNAGNAGFFFDWPVTVSVFDKDKKQIFWQGLQFDLRKLTADEDMTARVSIPYIKEIKDEFYIGVSITDYKAEDHIKLAIDSEDTKEFVGDVQLIYHYMREKN